MTRDGKRWHKGAGKPGWAGKPSGDYVAAPRVEAFLAEISEVCRRHGFDIEHEDGHGAFVIEELAEGAEPSAIMAASLGRNIPIG